MIDVLVILLVGIGLAWDLRTNRIPNWLTLSGMAAGLVINGVLGSWPGLLLSAKGLLIGLLILFIPFVLGGLGGGDVKLLGAIGALKGTGFILSAVLLTALWGGAVALLALIVSKRFKRLNDFFVGVKLFVYTRGKIGYDVMLPNEEVKAKDRLVVPYGIAIFLGTVSAYFITLPLPA
ncbi:MAG: prepilin peptidase [Bacillota bacterium]|uniref:prepilin peptidase n=1 Tax=Desulforudis sp. DRI-14 TaxID=3459793 RepID=UPI0034717938